MRLDGICLIGGTGRCGTSVLADIFSEHPAVSSAPGWRFLVDPDGIMDFYASSESWTPYVSDIKLKRLTAMLRALENRHKLSRVFSALNRLAILRRLPVNIRPRYASVCAVDFCPRFKELRKAFIADLKSFSYSCSWVGQSFFDRTTLDYRPYLPSEELRPIIRSFLLSVMGEVVNSGRAHFYLEKNIWHILWWDKILEILPEARLVHVRRDPRDVVLSFSRQQWMPSDIEHCAVIYKDLIARWEHIRDRVDPASFVEISFEELVLRKRETLEGVCRFWGVPWDDALLKIDLNPGSCGRWKKERDSVRTRLERSLAGVI